MPRIHQLDPQIVNQIAAGEVIERPGSVVKELLENSVDALAMRIEIDVSQGGTEFIRVVDNGEGIESNDFPLAVTSHATSKILQADDLFRVRTMGFRGEALASIASVSRLTIRSRVPRADTGYEIEVHAGQVVAQGPCGAQLGTTVEVSGLFLNTPVRRKFLKTSATEFAHVAEQFTRVALAHPRLHAVLKHNDRVVYELPAADQLSDRLRLFYGSDLVDQLIWVESQNDAARLWGFVGHPSQSKATRKGQYLFLNGRWIQDRGLQHALGEAYRGLLMVGRSPIAFLFLEVPPETVDVNVHPTKAEVRFRDASRLYSQLLSTLRTRFLGMDLSGSMRVRAGNGGMGPVADVDPAGRQQLELEVASWARTQLAGLKPFSHPGPSGTQFPPAPLSGAEFNAAAANKPTISDRDEWNALLPDRSGRADAAVGGFVDPGHVAAADRSAAEVSDPFSAIGQPTSAPLQSSETAAGAQRHDIRVMQVHDCYLVVETEEGLTVIDQHALHERVMYEQLRNRVLSGAVESQRLLVPLSIELGAAEALLLLENRDLLEQLGFAIEDFGRNTLVLTAYPPMLSRLDLAAVVRDLAEQLASTGQKPTRRDILDRLLHTMACKAAVKAGQRLTSQEMEDLVRQRHLIDDAHHCPHGRPTALNLSRTELDRQFGRLG